MRVKGEGGHVHGADHGQLHLHGNRHLKMKTFFEAFEVTWVLSSVLCSHNPLRAFSCGCPGSFKACKSCGIVFACPRVVEVEVGSPKVVDELSIHVLSCVSVIGTLSLIILRFAKRMRAVKS